ncbi:MAG: alpha/beta hydrolase [Patescibacteria group bacterium]|nr:alpha/beta hydrolase [Patescibacteria group bacterium]
MNRVFIIHGWDGHPNEGWFPWLKEELEQKGFEVQVPEMPETDEPKIETWVPYLAQLVGRPDENTYFVGHSIGCQAILRYLEYLPDDKKIGGAIFVAGWFTLESLGTDEEIETAGPWLETPIDFGKIKNHAQKFTAIFSDNDPYVPAENQKMFEDNLGAKIIIEHNKGHFSGSDKITELQSALEAILEISLPAASSSSSGTSAGKSS